MTDPLTLAQRLRETLSIFFTAREPGCGYFQGAEGSLRFVVFAGVVVILAAICFLVGWPL